MAKTVFRYFFDFVDGQEIWLNRMAAKGYRLMKCGKLSYTFELGKPNEYEYAVDFVGNMSYKNLKDYQAFLRSVGYHVFAKSLNANVSLGKVRWRPWGKQWGKIATSPGAFNKELLIIEKKKDGKPFELHTDPQDVLSKYQNLKQVYFWGVMQTLLLALIGFGALFYKGSEMPIYQLMFLILLAVALVFLGVRWWVSGMKYVKIIDTFKKDHQIYE